MPVLMFYEFGLKMPNYTPFWCFLGNWPLDGKQYQRNQQKANRHVIMVLAVN